MRLFLSFIAVSLALRKDSFLPKSVMPLNEKQNDKIRTKTKDKTKDNSQIDKGIMKMSKNERRSRTGPSTTSQNGTRQDRIRRGMPLAEQSFHPPTTSPQPSASISYALDLCLGTNLKSGCAGPKNISLCC